MGKEVTENTRAYYHPIHKPCNPGKHGCLGSGHSSAPQGCSTSDVCHFGGTRGAFLGDLCPCTAPGRVLLSALANPACLRGTRLLRTAPFLTLTGTNPTSPAGRAIYHTYNTKQAEGCHKATRAPSSAPCPRHCRWHRVTNAATSECDTSSSASHRS